MNGLPLQPSARFGVYALRDPETGCIRYIGKSVHPNVRRKDHTLPERKRLVLTTHCGRWVKNLFDRGLSPEFLLLEEHDDKESMDEAERRWIAHFRRIGSPLTNLTDGGDGGNGRRASRRADVICPGCGVSCSGGTMAKPKKYCGIKCSAPAGAAIGREVLRRRAF